VDFILTGQPEPPVYFAQMKKLNKIGAPVLGGLPEPTPISVDRLAALVGDSHAVVLDTRADRAEFYAGHLPGSLYAPISNRLSGFVGSYVDPERAIYLIARAEDVEEAVRNLIRIGYDNVVGFATPESLAAYAASGGELVTTKTIDFGELERLATDPSVAVLDVRGMAEYELGHVDGAVNVAHTRLLPRLAEVPTERTLALYCETGGRVSGASSFLQSKGYSVIAVDDDYAGWSSRKRESAAATA
jgi:hydroxyacylglutathione hydrolase